MNYHLNQTKRSRRGIIRIFFTTQIFRLEDQILTLRGFVTMLLLQATISIASGAAAYALEYCPGLPGSFGLQSQEWFFDTDTGKCTNGGAPPANGFRVLTAFNEINLDSFYTGGVLSGPNSFQGYLVANVTALNIIPNAPGANNIFNVAINRSGSAVGVYAVSFGNNNLGEQTYVYSITKNGISYTITIKGTFVNNTNIQDVISIGISGGAFDPSPSPTSPATTIDDPTNTQESTNLRAQQDSLSPVILNNTSYMINYAVSENVQARLNGNGLPPKVTQHGFYFQSDGTSRWLQQRQHGLEQIKEQLNGSDVGKKTPDENNVSDEYGPDDTRFGSTSEWNLWIRGYANFYDGKNGAFNGHTLDLIAGLDRKLGEQALVGVLTGYGKADFDMVTDGTLGKFDANGFHVGVYGGVMLGSSLIVDALVAYTHSGYDNASGSTIGSFNADRVTIAAHMAGSFKLHSLTVVPSVGFMHASERQDRYIDTAGIAHSARSISAGRLSVGPKVVLPTIQLAAGLIRPWTSAKFEYDFSDNTSQASGSSLPDFSNLSSARISSGIDSELSKGFTLNITGTISGLGSRQYISYGGELALSKSF